MSTIDHQFPIVKGSSPARTFQSKAVKHHRAMSTVQYGENAHCDEYVSPYSVLRGSTDADVDYAIRKLQGQANQAGLVMRSNRTQLLRQLALKQKLDKNPFLAARYKISRADALSLGEDPHFNDINYANVAPG